MSLRQWDVVVMNPPYQASSGNKGSNNILWDKFIEKAIDITKKDGYVSAIHPSAWRNFFQNDTKKSHSNAGKKITSKQIKYLEIHGTEDGIKTFNCGTRYDWYILKNDIPKEKTLIIDQNGIQAELFLPNVKFIPNFMIERILSLVAKDGEEKAEIICNSAYHTYNYNKNGTIEISKEKDDRCVYPVVNSVDTKNNPTLFYSSFNNKGHFGIPKIIFGNGATGFFIDINGEYGLTQWSKAIVEKPNNLNCLAKALSSDDFKEIIKAIAITSYETNHFVLSSFRKDFWKEFVDEKSI